MTARRNYIRRRRDGSIDTDLYVARGRVARSRQALRFFAALFGRSGPPITEEDWFRDPLCHPDLRRMTNTELADLPFDPARIRRS